MKVLFHLVLAVLLLGCLAAGTAAALWRFAPEVVDDWDQQLRERYDNPSLREFARLSELAEEEPEAALPAIQALAAELRTHKVSDRRYAVARRTDRLLVDTLMSLERTEEGVEAARELAAINPYDLLTRRWVAHQLLDAGEPYGQEGIDEMTRLFEQFPEHTGLARALYWRRFRRGEHEAALEVVLQCLEAIPSESDAYEQLAQPLRYALASSEAETSAPTAPTWATMVEMELFESRHWRIFSATIPADTRFVSITAPPGAQGSFGVPICGTNRGKTPTLSGPLFDLPHTAKDVTLDGRGLDFTGARSPTITFEPKIRPAEGEGSDSGNVLLRIGVPKDRFPSWMEAPLVSELAVPRVAEIEAAAGDSLRARFFAERVLLTRAYGMAASGPKFFIKGRGSELVVAPITATIQDRRAAAASDRDMSDAVKFEGSVTLESDNEVLDLMLPAVSGMIIRLDQVEWVNSEGERTRAGKVLRADPAQLAVIKGSKPRAWRVLPGAIQPILQVARPSGAGLTCELKGGLQ